VERRSAPGIFDRHGKHAEEALMAVLEGRKTPGQGNVTAGTPLTALVDLHISRLQDKGRSPATIDTYRVTERKLASLVGGIRAGEATAARMDVVIQTMRSKHGASMAKHARAVLRGALQQAVLAEVLPMNPMRDISAVEATKPVEGAIPLTSDQVRNLLASLKGSEFCRRRDLIDPIIMLAATGFRRGELLGLRWCDYDADAATITVAGAVCRVKGQGLKRSDKAKTDASLRTVHLPAFAMEMLNQRRAQVTAGEREVIFPSTTGSLRDPNNFGKTWRKIRDDLGLPDVTSHSFRKTVLTLIDEEGLSARVGADQAGHTRVSMTQDKYWARRRMHPEVADLLNRAINDD
jgi:integrase